MIPSDANVRAAAALLDARIGLRADAAFRPRVARAIRDLAASVDATADSVTARLADDAMLLDQLVDLVTVQETAFFRHPEQFETLQRHVLAHRSGPVKIWSAACANGQEAYSVAMVLSEALLGGSVLATDVSAQAVQRTRLARYTDREMAGLSQEQIAEHFRQREGLWEVDPVLRHLVTVRRHNLLDAIPPEVADCDVILCRNVLIYLDQVHAERFLVRLADSMKPDAVLFLGAAETLWHIDRRFEAIALGDGYIYRVRSKRPTSPPSAARIPPRRGSVVARPTAPAPPLNAAVVAQLGRDLLAGGDIAGAVKALRKWAYLAPDDATASFHLGAALRAVGDDRASRRAFRSSLAALDRCPPEELGATLCGYAISEFRRLLEDAIAADPSGALSTAQAVRP